MAAMRAAIDVAMKAIATASLAALAVAALFFLGEYLAAKHRIEALVAEIAAADKARAERASPEGQQRWREEMIERYRPR